MGQVLSPLNFDPLNIVERTFVSADLAAAQKVAVVENRDGFSDDDYFLLGSGEKAEIGQIDSVSGQSITAIDNYTFAHEDGEPFLKLRGNQIKIYRAANVDGTVPTDASFSALTTVDIQADQDTTPYYDSVGSSDYWYKFTYYNETSASETSLAQAQAVRGGEYGHYIALDDIAIEAGLMENFQEKITQIFVRRDHVESEVKGALVSAGYTLPIVDSEGAEFTPPIIENIVRLMSAGYVQMQHYSATGGSAYEEGEKKLKKGEALLERLQEKKLVLVDQYGIQISRSAGVNGWPDNTTKDALEEDAGGERMFSVKKTF